MESNALIIKNQFCLLKRHKNNFTSHLKCTATDSISFSCLYRTKHPYPITPAAHDIEQDDAFRWPSNITQSPSPKSDAVVHNWLWHPVTQEKQPKSSSSQCAVFICMHMSFPHKGLLLPWVRAMAMRRMNVDSRNGTVSGWLCRDLVIIDKTGCHNKRWQGSHCIWMHCTLHTPASGFHSQSASSVHFLSVVPTNQTCIRTVLLFLNSIYNMLAM